MLKKVASGWKNRKATREIDNEEQSGRKKFMVEDTPYKFTPSFIYHNGKYAAVLQMYFRSGSNRNVTFEDVIDFIPSSVFDKNEVFLLTEDALITDEEKKKIIRNNAAGNKKVMESREEEDADKTTFTASDREKMLHDMEDYAAYEMILDTADPIVVYRWSLMIVGDDRDEIDAQISDINKRLDQLHEGARWDSLPSEQEGRFTSLFGPLEKDSKSLTSTGANYAGWSIAVSAGLIDPEGVPIGRDLLSLTASTSYFDFNGYTRKQAIIAFPPHAFCPTYQDETRTTQPPLGSIVAQAAADHIVLNGHRAHHLVLNNFNFFEPGMYYRPVEVTMEDRGIFKHYDMSKVTINPLQGFGEYDEVYEVFARLKRKIVNIFNILVDLGLTANDKGILSETLNTFYLKRDLWSLDASQNPKQLTRIVQIQDEHTYPVLSELLQRFSTFSEEAQSKNRELKADNIDTLKSTLEDAISTYTSVLGETTSIERTDALQVYYDFSNMSSNKIKQVQLVNVIDYVIHSANKGDVIVLHGFDKAVEPVSSMLLESLRAAMDRKGIRVIFAMDTITGSDSGGLGKYTDIFSMEGNYYTDLDTDVDWSMLGRMSATEVQQIKRVLRKELGTTVEAGLQDKLDNQALVHRKVGQVNNFVAIDVLI